MNWYKKAQNKKIIYILRGISGSGKSTIAKKLPNVTKENIFSTDELIANNKNDYNKFFEDMSKNNDWTPLTKKHQENMNNIANAMRQNKTPIVYDDMNLEAWNCKEVVQKAMEYNYEVKFIDIGTGGYSAEELSKRNTHDVPLDEIQKMIDKYEETGPLDIKKVLESEIPENKL